MSLAPHVRRLLWAALAAVLVVAVAAAARWWLPGYAVRSVLRLAGASAVHYRAVRGTPWHLEVDQLEFQVRTQPCSARRVVLDRAHWWSASLGDVRVEGAELPVFVDGSDVDPQEWSTYENAGPGENVALPFVSIDLDGRLIVRMSALPDLPIDLKLAGRPKGGASWIGNLTATGPGFRLAGVGSVLRAGQELDFQVLSAELDLATWSRHVQRLVHLPGAPWEMGGKLTGVAEGKVTAKRFAATARVSLRDGAMHAGGRDVAAAGIDADLEFSDLWKIRTKAATLRLAELRVGRLAVRDITADFGLWGGRSLTVAGARGRALGGELAVDSFRYSLDQREVLLDVHATGLDPAELLALAPGIPARLPGRIDGMLPLRIHADGVRVERGYLALRPGTGDELLVNAVALLRSGAAMDAATTRVLRAAGAGPVRWRLDELRLEVRPPDLPLGSSARVHLAGRVEDQPVAVDLDVNGAIERYLPVLP